MKAHILFLTLILTTSASFAELPPGLRNSGSLDTTSTNSGNDNLASHELFKEVLSRENEVKSLYAEFSYSSGNGNGGDALICHPESSQGASIQLLDLYEAKKKGLSIELGGQELSVIEKVKLAISRVESKSYGWAKKMRSHLEKFEEETLFASDDEILVNIDDSAHLSLPRKCYIQQIAIQKEQVFGLFDPRYTIDSKLWSLLDKDNQASLILHELIYRELIKAEDSTLTRYFVQLIVSNRFKDMSDDEFVNLQKFNDTIDLGINYKNFTLYGDDLSKISLLNSFGEQKPEFFSNIEPNFNSITIQGKEIQIKSTRSFFKKNKIDNISELGEFIDKQFTDDDIFHTDDYLLHIVNFDQKTGKNQYYLFTPIDNPFFIKTHDGKQFKVKDFLIVDFNGNIISASTLLNEDITIAKNIHITTSILEIKTQINLNDSGEIESLNFTNFFPHISGPNFSFSTAKSIYFGPNYIFATFEKNGPLRINDRSFKGWEGPESISIQIFNDGKFYLHSLDENNQNQIPKLIEAE